MAVTPEEVNPVGTAHVVAVVNVTTEENADVFELPQSVCTFHSYPVDGSRDETSTEVKEVEMVVQEGAPTALYCTL